MKRAPAFQHYPDVYLSHTAALSLEADGFFNRILNWMWLHSADYCSIPDDPAAWAYAARCDIDTASRLMAEIQNPIHPLFAVENGVCICRGLQRKREAQEKVSKVRKQAALQKHAKKVQLHDSDMQMHTKEDAKGVQTLGVGVGVGVGDKKGESEGKTDNVMDVIETLSEHYGTSPMNSENVAALRTHLDDPGTPVSGNASERDLLRRFLRWHRRQQEDGKNPPHLPLTCDRACSRYPDLVARANEAKHRLKTVRKATPKPVPEIESEPPTGDDLAELRRLKAKIRA